MIAFDTRSIGERDLDGTPVQVRKRLTGWPDGIQFWVTDWRVINAKRWWQFWLSRYGEWHRASAYELKFLEAA